MSAKYAAIAKAGIPLAGLGGNPLADIMAARASGRSILVGSKATPAHCEQILAYAGEPAILTPITRSGMSRGEIALVILPWTVADARGQANIDVLGAEVFARVLSHCGATGSAGLSAMLATGLVGGEWRCADLDDNFDPTCIVSTAECLTQWFDNGYFSRNPSLLAVILVSARPAEDLIALTGIAFRVPIVVNYGSQAVAPIALTVYRPQELPTTHVIGETKVDGAGVLSVRGPHVAKGYVGAVMELDAEGYFNTKDHVNLLDGVLRVTKRLGDADIAAR